MRNQSSPERRESKGTVECKKGVQQLISKYGMQRVEKALSGYVSAQDE